MDAQTPEARVGSSIGPYRVDRLLGVGGMGAVFAVTTANGTFALKLLHSQLARDKSIRSRFEREAYVGNRIGHKGVPRTIDHGFDPEGGAPFMVMELLEGQSLEQRWERSRFLPAIEVLGYVESVLEVLDAAHAQGIIHRDIKPENVFLTRASEIKVLDFGVARLLDGASVTRSGELMGTPAFMPPEQAGGQVRQIDPRTDVWAVGAMMFTLITGQHVHEATTATQQLVFAATQPARSITTVFPNLAPAIAHLVDKALRFERDQRWPSAAAMRANLMAARMAPYNVPGAQSSSALRTAPIAAGPTAAMGRMALDPTALAKTYPGDPKKR